jgi:membrane protease YdiL (CAAX protease family)
MRRLPGDLALGALVGAISLAVTVTSLRLMSSHVALPPIEQFPVAMHIFFATVGALVPGVFEELYFRGLLFRVGAGAPKTLLVFVSAAAFAVWHIGTPAYLPHTFLLGLLWGTLFAATGRLAPSIIAHIVANASFGVLLISGYKLAGG